MSKLFLLFFSVCFLNLFAEETQITFCYDPDYNIVVATSDTDYVTFTGAVVSNEGTVFGWLPTNDSEIPYENERFIFQKCNNYECLDDPLYAIAVDELGQATGREFVFGSHYIGGYHLNHELIRFLQNNAWEMDWQKINDLREMTTFDFILVPGSWWNSGPSYVAKNKFCEFVLPHRHYLVGNKIRFFHQSYNNYSVGIIDYPGFRPNGFAFVEVNYLPKEMQEYIEKAVRDLEVELGTKIDEYYFN